MLNRQKLHIVVKVVTPYILLAFGIPCIVLAIFAILCLVSF